MARGYKEVSSSQAGSQRVTPRETLTASNLIVVVIVTYSWDCNASHRGDPPDLWRVVWRIPSFFCGKNLPFLIKD